MLDDLLARLDRRRELGFDAVEQRLDGAGHVVERLLAGVEPREAQQIAHEPLHAQRVAADDLEEPAHLGRFRAPFPGWSVASIEQRFDVAAHGRERRAQLVRDVGDEVAADAIGAAQVGDVVHDEHGAAPRRVRRPARCATMMTSSGSRGSESSRPSVGVPRSAAPSCAAMSGWRTIST